MSFDYFNVGALAYGKKISAAFNSLESLATDVDKSLAYIIDVIGYYDQYIGRNYIAPEPTRSDLPVRTNELFELIGRDYQFKTFNFNNGKVNIEFYYTHPDTHVFTVAKGSSSIKKGYCYFTPALWNANNEKTIRFSSKDDRTGNEILICRYSVLDDGVIQILTFGEPLENCYPYDWSQVTDILPGQSVGTFIDGKYTAQAFECLVVKQLKPYRDYAEDKDLQHVYLNGQEIMWDTSHQVCNFQVLYLKPGDVVTGTFEGFKLVYFNDRL